jgi:PAS domain S-box-containing protein
MQDSGDRTDASTLRRMVNRAPIPLSFWGLDLVCLAANPAFERCLGLSPGGWPGLSLRDAMGSAAFQLHEMCLQRALGGEEVAFELQLTAEADGGRWHRFRCCPDAVDSVVSGLVIQIEDLTDRQQSEDRLRASESFLDRTGRIAGVGGWEVDLRSRCLTWSDRTRRIHEVADDYKPTVEDAINFYAPEARPVVAEALREAMAGGSSWDLELPLVTARGRPIWVRAFGEVEYDSGVAVRLVGAFQDVTEQRQRRLDAHREHALRIEVERHAESLNRLLGERTEMLSVLAHEVRQPLNNASASLQSAAQTLAAFGEKVASRRLKSAQEVMSQVLGSIDNTLAVASLLARPDPIQRELTEVDTLLEIAIADMPAGERQRIRIERQADIRSISVDMSLMRLALRNLLSNALKFSPDDAAVVIRLADSDEPPALVIDVIDSGSGIAADRLTRLFERGSRVEQERNVTPQGMGLGLYIVRRVMELHASRVELAANGPDGATMRLLVCEPPEA